MPRTSRLDPAQLAAISVALALAIPARADPPVPQARPTAGITASDELQGNAPSTGADDLARLKAEIARQTQEREAREAQRRKLEAESSDLQSKVIGLAAKVQDQELAVSLTEDNIDVLNQREAQILSRLKLGRAQLIDTLAALELLEREQPPALAVRPEDATDAVRSAILLGEIVPHLTAQAESLGKELKSLRLIRERAAAEQRSLVAATHELKENQAQLESLIAERSARRAALGAEDEEQNRRIAELGRRAESLSALIEGLRDAQLARPRERPGGDQTAARILNPKGGAAHDGVWQSAGSTEMTFADARGRVRMPAVGKVVEKFGVPNESGGLTKGIKIGTRQGAQVVAPFDGRVKYAGPLKTYGNVLIVEAGDEYLIILAGLAHVEATVGQWLLAGEPIGRMADVEEDGPADLYLEFRRAREPFDPLPWLAGVTKEG